jgi:NADH:ubiquinone oxidoreductase subunit E
MTLDELLEIAEKETEEQKGIKHRLNVSVAAGCLSLHSDLVLKGLQTLVHERGMEATCKVKGVGCMGLCAAGPLMRCEPQHTYYGSVPADRPEVLAAIVDNLDRRSILCQAAENRAGELRRNRSGTNRRLHRRRRLPGVAQLHRDPHP